MTSHFGKLTLKVINVALASTTQAPETRDRLESVRRSVASILDRNHEASEDEISNIETILDPELDRIRAAEGR